MIIKSDTIFDWLEANADTYPELHGGFARGTGGVDEQVILQVMTRLDSAVARTAVLEEELGRAYRALRGIYGCVANNLSPNDTMLAYHSLTLGAAIRFVDDGSIEGTGYFIGRQVGDLHEALRRYTKATQ